MAEFFRGRAIAEGGEYEYDYSSLAALVGEGEMCHLVRRKVLVVRYWPGVTWRAFRKTKLK